MVNQYLLKRIEKEKAVLVELYEKHKTFSHPDVYSKSLEIDKLVLDYQKKAAQVQ